MDDEDLEVISQNARAICYQYAGNLPLSEPTGFILKGSRHVFVARISVVHEATAAVVHFSVLGRIWGLAECAILSVGWFVPAVVILRAIIWQTTDAADRIVGAIGVPIMIALGVWSTRLILRRASREIHAFRRPVEKILGADQGQLP